MFELMIESFGKKVGSRKRNSTVHLSSFIMNENCNHQTDIEKKLREIYSRSQTTGTFQFIMLFHT